MTRKYTFTEKDKEIIKEARKKNKDKRAEFRCTHCNYEQKESG